MDQVLNYKRAFCGIKSKSVSSLTIVKQADQHSTHSSGTSAKSALSLISKKAASVKTTIKKGAQAVARPLKKGANTVTCPLKRVKHTPSTPSMSSAATHDELLDLSDGSTEPHTSGVEEGSAVELTDNELDPEKELGT